MGHLGLSCLCPPQAAPTEGNVTRQDLEDGPFLIIGNLGVIIIIILLPHSAQHVLGPPQVMAVITACVEGEMFPGRVRLAAQLQLCYKTRDVWVGKHRAVSWEHSQEAQWDKGNKVQKV